MRFRLKSIRKIPKSNLEIAGTNVDSLLVKRSEKPSAALRGTKIVAGIGASSSFAAALCANPSFREGIAIIGSVTFVSAVMGGITGFANKSKEVARATHLVGKGLAQEAIQNKKLNKLLNHYKYVIVNKKGSIVGTNRKRFLGIGRLRLDNKKIVLGEY